LDLGVAATLRTEVISGNLTSINAHVNKWLYDNPDLEIISISDPITSDFIVTGKTAVVFIVFRNEKNS